MTDKALRAALEHRCTAGLATAARALVGGDPTPICRTFAAWKREQARRSWPWLPGLCWTALEPVGVAFPADDDDAVTLGRLLVGVETDPARVREALAALQRREVPPPGSTAGVGGADSIVELRRRTLETVVDRFWSEYAEGMRALRAPLASGDRPRADALVVRLRRRLEETAERVDVLARRLADVPATGQAPSRRPPTPFSTDPLPGAVGATGAATPAAASGVGGATDSAPAASPEHGGQEPAAATQAMALDATSPLDRPTRPAEPPAPREEPVERRPEPDPDPEPVPDPADIEYRVVRDRPLAPVLFLVGVTLGALVWLLVIVMGGS